MSTQTLLAADRINSLGEYFFAIANKKISELTEQGTEIINLGIGSPDLAPNESVIKTSQDKVTNPSLHAYPSYYGLPALRAEIAHWYEHEYGVQLDPKNMILPLAGSKEGLVFVTLAFVNPTEEVLIPNPGYSTYERATVIAGGVPRYYELTAKNHFLPDLVALEKQDLSKVKLIWINYPHNPTGAVATLEQLTEIATFAKKNHLIIASDNPYSHVTFDGFKAPSILQVPGAMEFSIELNSFSKTYNMAGWRLAWAAGNAQLLSSVIALYSNVETGVFLPIQMAGIEALKLPHSWIEKRNMIYQERREIVLEIAKLLKCKPFIPKAALYVWAKLPPEVTVAQDYCFDLLEKTGIFITPGTAFGTNGEGYVRLSLCQPIEVFQKAKSILKNYLAKKN